MRSLFSGRKKSLFAQTFVGVNFGFKTRFYQSCALVVPGKDFLETDAAMTSAAAAAARATAAWRFFHGNEARMDIFLGLGIRMKILQEIAALHSSAGRRPNSGRESFRMFFYVASSLGRV